MKNFFTKLGILVFCIIKLIYIVLWVLIIPILYPILAGAMSGYLERSFGIVRYLQGAIVSKSKVQNVMMIISLAFIWGYPIFLVWWILGFFYGRLKKQKTMA